MKEESPLVRALTTHIIQCSLPRPEKEYYFAKPRMWRFDMAWPQHMIAVECDGAVYSGGRHVRGLGYSQDCEKLNEAALLGWVVLRVTRDQIEDGRAVKWIERAIKGEF